MNEHQTSHIIVGIDPGKHTGYAEYDARTKRLRECEALLIHQAMRRIENLQNLQLLKMVVFEDARLRTWLGSKGREALQGAGSIKRDCTIWEDFLRDIGVVYRNIKPAAGATKWPAAKFAKMTGWKHRTNEHARDAAVLVWGA